MSFRSGLIRPTLEVICYHKQIESIDDTAFYTVGLRGNNRRCVCISKYRRSACSAYKAPADRDGKCRQLGLFAVLALLKSQTRILNFKMRIERALSKLDSLLICILQLSFTLHASDLVHAASSYSSNSEHQGPRAQQQSPPPYTADSVSNTLPVYWSKELDSEQSRLALFSYKDGQDFSAKVHSEAVVKLEAGCGRPKNLLATLADGTKVCCRYRENQVRELRGDLYSYHLSGYLGLWNAPPTAIVSVDFSSKQWTQVAGRAMEEGWKDGSVVAMTLFINDLIDVYFPPPLRDIMHKNVTITRGSVSAQNLGKSQKHKLMQWSDMALFDFIIGHTDRVFNTLYNYQWNKNMMEKKVHNLLKTFNGQLVLIDNESGFWMGYAMGATDPLRYALQEQLLGKFCVFRKSTVEKIKSLTREGLKPATRLEEYIKTADSRSFMLMEHLAMVQRNEFNSRVSISLELIEECIK